MRWPQLLLRVALLLVGLVLLMLAAAALVSEGVGGERHERGVIAQGPLPEAVVAARSARSSRILFGDLHVHTTYSADAFVFSLPLFQGEGVHPPADACDFARYCAELDFWSINDHAEHLTPFQWQQTIEAVRECNAAAGDPASPDLVSFLGWEWTQSATPGAAREPRPHYGHKNVILLDDQTVPTRPIGAGRGGVFAFDAVPSAAWWVVRASLGLSDPGHLSSYLDFNRFSRDVRGTPLCDEDVPVRDLPPDCLESAETPERLFAKLDDWGLPSLVVPHGTSWGIHAPVGSDLAVQLGSGQHDPSRQRLFEVYSGHGSSERFVPLRDSVTTDAGEVCAPPRDGYLPCCWRAGELVRARCGELPADACEARVEQARADFLAADWLSRYGTVPDARPDEWLECGQLTSDFLPAYEYRPGMSAQYGLAVRDFAGVSAGEPGAPGAFRYGLIASSDNHKARAGAGYKELARKAFGDAYGLRGDWRERLGETLAKLDPGAERGASYYYTAGLVAVHAASRDRGAIFAALQERRVYGTSGPRILLWFDARPQGDGHAAPVPMGSELFVDRSPRFSVRALGAFVQRPGCPQHTRERLSPERLARLCLGECYHPGDTRQPIERIEIVRIRPQQHPDEPIAERIEDPWRVLPCPADGTGCVVDFHDPEYRGARETLYYVRALQAPTPAVNGDPLRCERDAEGRCLRARSCPASGEDFEPQDDCLAPVRERAWSSPIWLRPAS